MLLSVHVEHGIVVQVGEHAESNQVLRQRLARGIDAFVCQRHHHDEAVFAEANQVIAGDLLALNIEQERRGLED